jgi:hypothetical protein
MDAIVRFVAWRLAGDSTNKNDLRQTFAFTVTPVEEALAFAKDCDFG